MIAFARACFALSTVDAKRDVKRNAKPDAKLTEKIQRRSSGKPAMYRASRNAIRQPALKLSNPAETIIVPWHQDRIDAEIGEDDQINKLIVYVRRQPPRRRRRLIDRIWR